MSQGTEHQDEGSGRPVRQLQMAEAPPLKVQSRTFGDDPEFQGQSKSQGGSHSGLWFGVVLCLFTVGALIAFRSDRVRAFGGNLVRVSKSQSSAVGLHKQKYLSARERGHLEDMRFHQNALLKLGFLQQKVFIVSNRPSSKVQLNMDGIQEENLRFATIEPRADNRLSIIAVKEDMALFEELVRLADVKE